MNRFLFFQRRGSHIVSVALCENLIIFRIYWKLTALKIACCYLIKQLRLEKHIAPEVLNHIITALVL